MEDLSQRLRRDTKRRERAELDLRRVQDELSRVQEAHAASLRQRQADSERLQRCFEDVREMFVKCS